MALTTEQIKQGYSTIPGNFDPVTGNVITPQSLAPQPKINLDTPAELQTPAPTVEGDMAFFNQLQNQQTAETQALKEQQSQKNTGVESLMRDLGLQGQEQLSLEQQFVNPLQSQITDLTGQLGVDLADYQKAAQQYEKLKTDLEVGVRGSGNADIRASMLFGQQGAVDRAKAAELNVKASDIAIKQANILALQGKTDLAQKQVDRAIDLKYKAKENELKIQMYQLDQIKDNLNASEKKQAEARNFALQREEKRIAEQKQNEKDIQSITLEAVKNGADQATITAIGNAKDFNEALKVSGGFLATPQTDIVKLDNGNTIMIDKRTGKIIKSFGGIKAETGTGGYAVTNNALKTVYNNDAVALISNIIKDSKAKPNQTMTDAINVIAGVQELAKTNPTGKFPGLAPIRLTPNRFASKEARTNQSNLAALNLKVQQWASGASLTKEQTKFVNTMVPEKNDTDRQVRDKTNALANYMMSQVSGQLAGQGISFTNDKSIDYFEPSSDDQLKTLYKDTVKSKQIEEAIQLYPDATADEILQIVQ